MGIESILSSNIQVEKLGFWSMLILYILQNGVFPMIKTYIPSRIKLTEREQDREDKRLEFEQKMELRHVEALESIKDAIVAMKEKIERIDNHLQQKDKIKRPRK